MKSIKFAAAFALIVALAQPQMALAQQAQAEAAQGTLLTISAEGKTTGRPDMATISLGVTTQAQTAQAATQANARQMSALIAALRRAGIAERDIQTSNISVNPQQQYHDNEPPVTPVRFRPVYPVTRTPNWMRRVATLSPMHATAPSSTPRP